MFHISFKLANFLMMPSVLKYIRYVLCPMCQHIDHYFLLILSRKVSNIYGKMFKNQEILDNYVKTIEFVSFHYYIYIYRKIQQPKGLDIGIIRRMHGFKPTVGFTFLFSAILCWSVVAAKTNTVKKINTSVAILWIIHYTVVIFWIQSIQ